MSALADPDLVGLWEEQTTLSGRSSGGGERWRSSRLSPRESAEPATSPLSADDRVLLRGPNL